jgi:hypothetical protein
MFAFWAPHARSKSAMGMWTKPGVLRRTNLLDDYRRSFDSLEAVENFACANRDFVDLIST